jgi:hypothetical protein
MTDLTGQNTWDVVLDYPVTVRGTTYEKLNFRRAKAKDIAYFSDSKKADGQKMLHMAARLGQNGFSDDEFGELDAQDFTKVMELMGKQMGVKKAEDSEE